jgi:thiamine biosynthesis lipoprotein
MAIDLEGLAKGFATELAAGSLRRRNLSGVIDAGGTQYMVGNPPGKAAWSVGIGHPDRQGALVGALDLADGGVSTTSDMSNLLPAGSRGLGRVLDPRTLQPSAASVSATVVSGDGTLANALSRAAFVLGPVDGLALLDRFPSTWGVVAYRHSDGSIGIRVSPGHLQAFHPVPDRQETGR